MVAALGFYPQITTPTATCLGVLTYRKFTPPIYTSSESTDSLLTGFYTPAGTLCPAAGGKLQ